MFEIGDYIVKPIDGVCRLENIVHLDMAGIDKNRLYYLLIPIEDPERKIYVPTDKTDAYIRKAMTNKEALEWIEKIPEIEEIWVENEKQREQIYKNAIKSCDPKELIKIIKITYMRTKKRMAQGKKSTVVDDRFFRIAENHLYAELGFALNKSKNEICNLITETINKKDCFR